MFGDIRSMTFEQAKKLESKTDWERVRNEEPDITDPDAPDFSETMIKEIKKMTNPERIGVT